MCPLVGGYGTHSFFSGDRKTSQFQELDRSARYQHLRTFVVRRIPCALRRADVCACFCNRSSPWCVPADAFRGSGGFVLALVCATCTEEIGRASCREGV